MPDTYPPEGPASPEAGPSGIVPPHISEAVKRAKHADTLTTHVQWLTWAVVLEGVAILLLSGMVVVGLW